MVLFNPVVFWLIWYDALTVIIWPEVSIGEEKLKRI